MTLDALQSRKGARAQRINSFADTWLLQRASFSLRGVGVGVCCATNPQMFFSCLSLRQKNSLRALKTNLGQQESPVMNVRRNVGFGMHDELIASERY